MRWFRFLIILLVMTLLNAGNLLNTIAVTDSNIRPNLLLILLVFFALNCDGIEAVIVSFTIGFAADISGTVMGPCFLSYGLIGTLISQFRKVVIMKRVTYQILAISITTLVVGSLVSILMYVKTRESMMNTNTVLLGTAVYSGLVSPVIWVILSKVSTWLGVHMDLSVHRKASYRSTRR